MGAKELRIGNYVNKSLKSGNGRILIDKIGCQDIVRVYENIGSFNYEPIPLTEKWLLDFGFEKETILSLHIRYVKNGFAIWHDTVKNIFVLDNLMKLKLAFKTVHHLQNTFNVLTGEELTINTDYV